MHLEVQVRIAARVAESPFHAICWPAVTFAPFGTANATSFTHPPLLSLRGGEVVVQVDVEVRRAAAAVVVEHAAAEAGLPVLDAPVLDRDDRCAPGILHVDPRVAAVSARVAVVVPEVGLRDEREHEPRYGASLAFRSRGSTTPRPRGRRGGGRGVPRAVVRWRLMDGALRCALEGADANRPKRHTCRSRRKGAGTPFGGGVRLRRIYCSPVGCSLVGGSRA